MSATDVPFVAETPQKKRDSLDGENEDWDEKDAWRKCLELLRFRGEDSELNAFENSGTTDLLLFLELQPKTSLIFHP